MQKNWNAKVEEEGTDPGLKSNFDKREVEPRCRGDRDISHATLNQSRGIADANANAEDYNKPMMVENRLISFFFSRAYLVAVASTIYWPKRRGSGTTEREGLCTVDSHLSDGFLDIFLTCSVDNTN